MKINSKELNNKDLALIILSKIKDKHPKRQLVILEKAIKIITEEFSKVEFSPN